MAGYNWSTHGNRAHDRIVSPYLLSEAETSGLRDALLYLAVWVAGSSARGPDDFHVADAASIPPAAAKTAATAEPVADGAGQPAADANPEPDFAAWRHSGANAARLAEPCPPWAELPRCRGGPQDDCRCLSAVQQRVAHRCSRLNSLAEAVEWGAEQPWVGSRGSKPSAGFRLMAVRQPVAAAGCSGLECLPDWADSFQSSSSAFPADRSPRGIADHRGAERAWLRPENCSCCCWGFVPPRAAASHGQRSQ